MRPSCWSYVSLLFILLGWPGSAGAQPAGSARAYGEAVNLSLRPLLGPVLRVSSGPLPVASGTLQPPFSGEARLASAAVSLGVTGDLVRTDLLTSRVTGAEGGQVAARSRVDRLRLSLGTLLTLGADTVTSRAEIRGSCGGPLLPVGQSSLERAGAGGLLGLGLALPVDPAPNTVLLNWLGVRVVLNEQVVAGDGLTALSLTVRALHVTIQNSLLTGIGGLSGDLEIAHSEVSRQCEEVIPGPEADLELDLRSEASQVEEGSSFSLELRVTSYGPEEPVSVVLADVLPCGADVISALASQGSCAVGDTLTCDLGSLATGARASVWLTLQPRHEGPAVYEWRVASEMEDPDLSNNDVRTQVAVLPPP